MKTYSPKEIAEETGTSDRNVQIIAKRLGVGVKLAGSICLSEADAKVLRKFIPMKTSERRVFEDKFKKLQHKRSDSNQLFSVKDAAEKLDIATSTVRTNCIKHDIGQRGDSATSPRMLTMEDIETLREICENNAGAFQPGNTVRADYYDRQREEFERERREYREKHVS